MDERLHAVNLPALPSDRVGQGTRVEQARAVADVLAAVQAARQWPRNIHQAKTDLAESCTDYEFAEAAFYRYKRGGSPVTGPTIKLAHELARCFCHIRSGVVELRRDDEFGQSEMLARCTDMQTGTMNETTWIVVHRRDKSVPVEGEFDEDGNPMTTRVSVPLVDLRDIYEQNANEGSRRVRAMIIATLPAHYVKYGVTLCRQTLERGKDGTSLEARRAKMVEEFGRRHGVTPAQLEAKLRRPIVEFTAFDLSELGVIWGSLERREVTVDEEFGASPVTVGEIVGGGAVPPASVRHAQPAAAPPVDDGVPEPPPEVADRLAAEQAALFAGGAPA